MLDESRRKIGHSHFLDKTLSVQCYEDAYILPCRHFNAGVADANGIGVLGTQACERYKVGYPFNQNDVEISDDVVIYMGYLKSIFGHCITDNIKREWFIQTEEYRQLMSQGAICVYILPEDEMLSPVFVSIMGRIGIDVNSWRRITKETHFKKIYVPDNSLIYDNDERYWTREFQRTVNRIKIAFYQNNTYPSKIYYSRSRFSDISREYGEKRIEDEFKKKGYTIVYPEKENLADQIGMVMNCTHFASTEGSVSHWVLFCKENTDVVILRKADYINTYQVAINEVANINATYIDANYSKVDDNRWPWAGPFFLYVTPQLLKYLGSSFVVPYVLNPKYWWYIMRNTNCMKRYITNRHLVRRFESYILNGKKN